VQFRLYGTDRRGAGFVGAMIKNPELKAVMDNITDCIACGDCGVKLFRFLSGLNDIQAQAEEGSEAAHDVLDVVYKFERLIKALTCK